MSGADLPLAPQPDDTSGDRVDTNTWQMWAIALLPLASLPLNAIPVSIQPGPDPVGFIVSITVGLALIAAEVALAVSDRRELLRRGVWKPMHPAWALLDGVYVIGRTVVVRRRVGGSALPLWVWLAGTALVLLIP